MATCPNCGGSGKAPYTRYGNPCHGGSETYTDWCRDCHGTGEVNEVERTQEWVSCTACGGSGKVTMRRWKTYPDGCEIPGTSRTEIETCNSCNGKGGEHKTFVQWKPLP